MLDQGYLNNAVYEASVAQPLPTAEDIRAPEEQPVEGVDAGYFTSWVQQQVIERYGQRAFYGGLRVTTTLNLELQRAAEQAISNYLPDSEDPSASLVAIENSTGEVRAMVGGRNYDESSFNLATEGERQPGSSFKAFDLAAALEDGISPDSEWASKEKTFIVPNSGGHEKFVVHNDEGNYTGENTLTGATAYSDNSIFAEVGLKVGTHRIARLAHKIGITTPISTNPAMTIGGLHVGVTPLDMAHAYETIAHGGRRVSGTLAAHGAPVAIQEVQDGSHHDVNHVVSTPVLPPEVAATETEMLETVLQYGTAKVAALGEFAAGKTGTTSNYVDAWFVGWNHKYTVAVWVGYPEGAKPMTTDYDGGPVLGGTFPALIWHNFMISALQIEKAREQIQNAEYNLRKGPQEGERQRRRNLQHREPGNRHALHHGHDAESCRGSDDGRRQGKRKVRHARWRQRIEPHPPRHTQSGRRTGTHSVTDADDAHAGIPQRTVLPLLPLAVHALLALADGRGQSGGLAIASGRGRDTCLFPATQKRQRSSTAFVIPIRVPPTTLGARGRMRTGPSWRSPPLSDSSMPSACVSLPGPEQRSCSRTAPLPLIPRRAYICSIPSSGSSARISTAAPTPSGSQTALNSAWIP